MIYRSINQNLITNTNSFYVLKCFDQETKIFFFFLDIINCTEITVLILVTIEPSMKSFRYMKYLKLPTYL
jgi:hypothetical protein